ncbi:DedA family protein [Paenibacillus lautus]|jgi:membrane-associated protein|uniref:DedA family protein n=1 Tax=Paenibacillus lautus TaxID=1401 RepID=UPI000FD94E94|nr:DedA family protein [Paenibacillus lautus]
MISDTIIQLVEQYGYLAFFLAFSLGPFGIPVPNEVTILTGGILSNTGVLDPWITYIFIFVGLITAITISYFAGRILGRNINIRFQDNRHFQKAKKIFKQRGDLAMCLGLFIPLVRYIIPLVVGLEGVKFKKFALISYSSVFLWTALFFTAGRYLGEIVF